MLRVGLTGGIGSGKSTVARRLAEHGAVLVDSDALAREVVAPGTDGLAEIVAAFGNAVLDADGALDRPALAGVVFADAGARERLNAIVHPRVRRRSDELIGSAPADAVVVQDVPLLVEGAMAPLFPLVVVVHAEAEERVRRLVHHRGMPEVDARARIAAQADDAARRAAADVWLDNSGVPGDLTAAVDALWTDRFVPFEENLRRRRVAGGARRLGGPDPAWAGEGARLCARVLAAAGERARVAHIGVTAVPGLPAEDVLEIALGVDSPADADTVGEALQEAGFPRCSDAHTPRPASPGPAADPGPVHGSADPGRPATLYVRPIGSPRWRHDLLVRDWLRADEEAREEYRAARGEMSDRWWDTAGPRAEAWAGSAAWSPSLH